MSMEQPSCSCCCCCEDENTNESPQAENDASCSNEPVQCQTVLQKRTLKWSMLPTENRFIGKHQLGVDQPIDLKRSLQGKILEVVDKEETFNKKGAEDAKKKPEIFKNNKLVLMQQMEKDKELMNKLARR